MNNLPYSTFLTSPVGVLKISGSEAGISAVSFMEEVSESPVSEIPETLLTCKDQLTEYFAGSRKIFDLKIAPNGTEFQQQVWQHLQQIPFGKTCSYLDIALKFGEPTYTRAVGTANGRNPLAIIVPCHRVIGTTGSLTGYAGGLWRKKWLLEFEAETRQGSLF